MRIDAHQHFWQYSQAKYGWITDRMEALKRDFMPDDLRPLLQELGFDGCVAVQALQNLDETLWLLELATHCDFIRGVVGWVDLCSPRLRSQIQAFAAHPRFVGVRHVLQDESDDRFMLLPAFRQGIAQLAEFSLTYDLLIYPRQLSSAAILVDAFPQQAFVLDHIAKPSIAEGKFDGWEPGIRELASLPNVYCKLSGMVTEARWEDWQPRDFHHCLDVVLDAFGPDRLMIGSDWPVCTLAAGYGSAMEIVLGFIENLPRREQEGILGENCRRFYDL